MHEPPASAPSSPPFAHAVRWLLLSELSSLCAAALGQSTALWWLASQAGAQGLTLYAALIALTALVSLPALSPLGDRCSRVPLITSGQAVLMAVALLSCVLAVTGQLAPGPLTVCGVLATVAQAAVQPAQTAALLDLVPADRLPGAIRLRRGIQAVGGLCGPAMAGAVLSWGSLSLAFALQGLLSGLALLTMQALRHGRSESPPPPQPRGRWRDDLLAGLHAKWQVRVDRWWTLSGALMMVFYGPAVGLLLPLRLQALGAPPGWLGWCGSALSAGVLIGVLGAADGLMARVGRHRAMLLAVAVCGLCLGAVGAARHPWVLAVLFLAIGLCTSVTQLMGQTHRAVAVPEDFRARMAAAQLAVAHIAAACAPLVAGLALRHWPVAWVYGLASVGFLSSGLALLAVPGLRSFLGLSPREAQGWYERQYPGAFLRPAGRSDSRHSAPAPDEGNHPDPVGFKL